MRYIYKITNNINGKVYIGQTIDYIRRWRHHIVNNVDSLIHKAILKYGVNNFSFKVLFTRHDDFADTAESNAIRYYKTLTPTGYNIETGGFKNKICSKNTRYKLSLANKGKKRSDLTKKRISVSRPNFKHTEETKQKISEAGTGRHHTVESKKRMSLIQTEVQRKIAKEKAELLSLVGVEVNKKEHKLTKHGKVRKPCSEETKRKIALANKGRKKTPELLELARQNAIKQHKREQELLEKARLLKSAKIL